MSAHIATFATIFFSMILVNNYVLVQFLGICPFLGVSKKLDSSVGMGAAVIVVMVIATAVTFPMQILLLDKFNLGYLQTIVFILVIAVLVQLIEIVLKKYVPALYQSLGVYLPLITTNCCVLGVTILAVQDYSAVVTEFGFGMAYAEALVCASRPPTRRKASRACPSRWFPPLSPRSASWALVVWSKTSSTRFCKKGEWRE